MCFKVIIFASLPSSQQTYVEPYNGNANDPNDPDPKQQLSSDVPIGLLCEEYKICLTRSNNRNNKNGTYGSVNLGKTQNTNGTSKSLEDRIMDHKSSIKPYCDHCKCAGHWLSKCHKFDGNKCWKCRKIEHYAKNCWGKKKSKEKHKKKGDESNMIEEHIVFPMEEEMLNFDTYNTCNADGNDEQLIFYDWLADSVTTSHVMHQ